MRRMTKVALTTLVGAMFMAVGALGGVIFLSPASATADYCDRCPETLNWNTTPERVAPYKYADSEVISIRQGWHPGCKQRVVFDVNGHVNAGYSAAYVQQAHAVGSGKPIAMEGDSILRVTVNARGRTLGQPGKPFFVQSDFRPASPVNEVRFGGSFEGQSVFYIGLDGKPDFAASRWQHDGTTRYIVDAEAR